MSRPQWEDLPATVRAAVEAQTGRVLKAEPAAKALVAGIITRLHIEDGGSLLLRAIPADSPAAPRYARERGVGTVLPPDLPAPRLRWSRGLEGWTLLLFDYIDGRPADLTPGSPDIPLVTDTVSLLNEVLTPCPARARVPDVADNLVLLQDRAEHLIGSRDLGLPYQVLFEEALRGFRPEDLAGDTLLHYDLTPHKLLICDGQAYATNWALAAKGAAWIEPFALVPRLIMTGHPPSQAEALMAAVPSWRTAPKEAVAALAALWTLSRLFKVRTGPPKRLTGRARKAYMAHAAEAAEAGRSWLVYCTM
ncbi:hypothetical protein [Streptosporangium sp. CA-115845]|uniref:hypothetical protein n=1 Tax=Streptosporangium sp. CA-115845 TaxID=3240071 RepID=UPI003D8A8041